MEKSSFKRLKHVAVERVGVFFLSLAAAIFSHLPLWVVRSCAYVNFWALYPLVGILFGLRRRVARNILIAYRDSLTKREARAIAKRVIFNQLVFFMDLFYFQNPRNRKTFRKRVTIEGIEHLASARADGKGAIGVSAHLGNFQIMMLRLAMEDDRFVSLIKQLKSEAFDRRWNQFMDVNGLKRIMMENRVAGAKQVVRELRNSSFVMFVADEFTRRGGYQVTFFGRKTFMAAGPAQLSLKLKVPLLPTYIIRKNDGNYRIIIEEPIEFTPTGDSEEDIVALTQKRIDNLERTIREYTDQWLWTQSRWKKRRHDTA